MIVGWDLDGVGYIFGASVRNYLTSIGLEVADPTDEFRSHWNFFEFWGMTADDFAKHCDDGVDAGYIFAPGDDVTRAGFFDSVRRVKEAGHTNVVITHRYQGTPGKAEELTHQWLEPVKDVIDEIFFTKNKTVRWTDVFVEDNKDNYDNLASAGTNAFLINRPWNAPYDDGRKRINDVVDYADLIVKHGDRLAPKRVYQSM